MHLLKNIMLFPQLKIISKIIKQFCSFLTFQRLNLIFIAVISLASLSKSQNTNIILELLIKILEYRKIFLMNSSLITNINININQSLSFFNNLICPETISWNAQKF